MKNLIKLMAIFLLLTNLHSSDALEKVSLQLDWKFQFQHAGFIVAKEKGFYKKLGLDVTFLEYQDGVDIEKEVLANRVDFGISNTPLMFKNGVLKPAVIVATYLQKSPLVFVTQPYIKNPTQLNGKKIMATEYEYKNSSLSLLMEHFFIKGIYVPHSYGIEEFKDKKIDAMSAFISNEIYDLDKQNIQYNIIDPFDYGFFTNGMNLFSSYETAKQNPKKIENFLKATKKGWQYAFDNTDETIELIHSKYNKNKSKEALLYEAKKIKELMLLDLYNIGEVSKELVIRAYKQLARSGKILPNQEDKILIFKEVLEKLEYHGLRFTKEENAYLKQKGVIKLCVDPNWMPFEGIKDGQYIGMLADYFDLVREKTNLKIEVYPTKTWDESINAIKNRKCDIIGSASPTPERLKYMDFTDTYMKSPIVLVTKMDKTFMDNIDDIVGKKIGITKSYAIAEILRAKYPDINIVDVQSIQDGMKRVESGELYGYVDNLGVTVANIRKDFHGTLKVSARLNINDDLTIGSRSDEPMLNSIFQKVVHTIDEAKVRHILNEWISVKESVKVDYAFLWKIAFGILLVFAIITFYNYRLRLNNKKLLELSREDVLTKIGNRLRLNEILADQYMYTNRYRVTCGIILVDIDDFKKVNDNHGHLEGDEVLKKFAATLLANIRETDKLGRWGGEEFLIVCPNTNEENLMNVAELLRKKIENTSFGENIGTITCSIGISVFDGDKTIEEILDKADRGLYDAKGKGKNRVINLEV